MKRRFEEISSDMSACNNKKKKKIRPIIINFARRTVNDDDLSRLIAINYVQ